MTNIRYKNCSESSALGKLQEVKEHWESETVGTRYSISETRKQFYAEIRQARYELEPFIKSFADFEKSHSRFVICDFICPTKETRDIFQPDIVIFMDTIKKGRFEDTNKMFEDPKSVDFHINKWNETNHITIAKNILEHV